jgi:4-hydroxy-4-methyl-2-oxoglutarate aldolase
VRSGPGRVGLPIVCAGVAVQSGDVVLGDRDGVVIVPRADLAGIVAKLADIRRAEEETQAKIRAGMTQMESMDQLLKSDRVVYVD